MIALVQGKRRKAHIATIKPGQADYVSICDLYIKAQGAQFWQLVDAIHVIDAKEQDVCRHCFRIVLMADVIAHARTKSVAA